MFKCVVKKNCQNHVQFSVIVSDWNGSEKKNSHNLILLTNWIQNGEHWTHHYRIHIIIYNNNNGISICRIISISFFLYFGCFLRNGKSMSLIANGTQHLFGNSKENPFPKWKKKINKNKLIFDIKSIWIFIDFHRLMNGIFMATLANKCYMLCLRGFRGLYTAVRLSL